MEIRKRHSQHDGSIRTGDFKEEQCDGIGGSSLCYLLQLNKLVIRSPVKLPPLFSISYCDVKGAGTLL